MLLLVAAGPMVLVAAAAPVELRKLLLLLLLLLAPLEPMSETISERARRDTDGRHGRWIALLFSMPERSAVARGALTSSLQGEKKLASLREQQWLSEAVQRL